MHTVGQIDGADVRIPERRIPVMAECDVLVCGGGPGGTTAAIAAASLGARTMLVERHNHLGGLATGGLVIVLPALTDSGRQIVGGIGLKLRETLRADGKCFMRGGDRDSSYFDPEALKTLSERFCMDAGVEMLHHVWVSGVVMNGTSVNGAVIETKLGTRAITAKVVVDATGDGDAFAAAGCRFEKTDQSIGLDFRIGNVDLQTFRRIRDDQPDTFSEIISAIRDACDWHGPFQLGVLLDGMGTIWGNNGLRTDCALDPKALTQLDIDARQRIDAVVRMLKERMPGFEDAWLIDTACQTGVRRSRRLVGRYVINGEESSQSDFRHPDAVGRGNDFRREGIAYDIPYGALLPRDAEGLLTCGRCVSCDDSTLEPMRVIQVCWVTGQAAGTAAALATDAGIVPSQLEIAPLQAALRAADVAFA